MNFKNVVILILSLITVWIIVCVSCHKGYFTDIEVGQIQLGDCRDFTTQDGVLFEQGFIGIILLVSFFISNLTFSLKNKKKLKNYSLLSILFVFCCLVGIIYNCSLELEAGYLIAFMCSIINNSNKTTKYK